MSIKSSPVLHNYKFVNYQPSYVPNLLSLQWECRVCQWGVLRPRPWPSLTKVRYSPGATTALDNLASAPTQISALHTKHNCTMSSSKK